MGQAYLVRRGGGVNLQFRVVMGAEQPEAPRENTIWIQSDAAEDWIISASEPENPTDGLAWLRTGSVSELSFDAIKNGSLIIAPIGCMVYEDGVWASAAAEIYQDGAWHGLEYSVIKDGVLVREMQVRGGKWVSGDDYTSNNPALTQMDGYVEFVGSKTGYGMAYIENVDLTGRKELVIEGTFTPKDYVRLCVWSQLGTYLGSNIAAYVKLTETGGRIDISENALTGEYVIGFTSQAMYVQQITNFYLR